MRRQLGMMIVGSAIAWAMPLGSGAARAQVVLSGADPYRLNGYFAAPGLYGTAWGAPSVGMPRTDTAFASPFGAGYGFGYAPYGMLPGKYGVGLWRPGFVAPGYIYGASYYRTFALPGVNAPEPPIGYYAPGFGAPSPLSYGPPSYYGW